MPPSHHQTSKTSSVGRLEALEADIAVLKAERALDILSTTLTRWIDQFYAAEKPPSSVFLPPAEDSRPIPDSYKDDVARSLADIPAAISLLQSPNLWPALQDLYHEVVQERQRKLHQGLAVVNTIMREAKSQERRLLKRKNAVKNQKNAVTTSLPQAEVETASNPAYQTTDFHPAHCAASTEQAVLTNENSKDDPNTKEQVESNIPAAQLTQEVLTTEPHALIGASAIPEHTAIATFSGVARASAPKRAKRRPLMTASQTKRTTRGPLKVGANSKDTLKNTIDEFVIPADPLSAIMHSIVPAYLSDDDHKIFGEVHGFDRRRIPQIESDSGVATRPRRSRKSRKMPKAP